MRQYRNFATRLHDCESEASGESKPVLFGNLAGKRPGDVAVNRCKNSRSASELISI
jgi:hypothetical protein